VTDQPYIDLLVGGADDVAAEHVAAFAAGVPVETPHRETMRAVLALVSVYVSPGSRHHGAAAVLPVVDALVAHLEGIQNAAGLFDGDNLSSPPDSSFTVNDLCIAQEILAGHPHAALAGTADRLRAIALRALPALLAGGVHTPNHRWELASALARIDALWPHPSIAPRIDAWLAEGIDVDEHGIYSERSPNYAAYVSNPALMAIAHAHDRPDLLDPVRANLRTTIELTSPDGEVETVQSRRQDQREVFHARSFLSQYRWFAIVDGAGDFARVVEEIIARGVSEPVRHLAELLADPVLARALPEVAPAASEARLFLPAIGLAHERSDDASLTVFGGSDFARTRRIASGLSNSAIFLRMRRGAAILESLRLSPQFFDLGAFRAGSIEPDGDSLVLRESRTSGYYQPLAGADLSPTGDYALVDEGRFFGSMDFGRRALSPISLETTVTVASVENGADVSVGFQGAVTDYSLELVFRPGGVLTGAATQGDHFVLTDGVGGYTVDGDTVSFGAADGSSILAGRAPRFDEGEMFEYVGGNDRVPGVRVLIGGRTDVPFTLALRHSSV
jgi:hypothetical protein